MVRSEGVYMAISARDMSFEALNELICRNPPKGVWLGSPPTILMNYCTTALRDMKS